ncbi:hypothetical protein [Rhizobium glycinendophyticum]|uniref:Uncharacterized protein n=1 Tax=Rhizobium glycinendophyticum TaxID=2589807 RepID=A0A504U4E1_9HYPH|nr:hypothetical protein [Rhizobium glycinendophyticum]TPP09884.1 hypothetical protein FJQ55_03130 [Rhizobium glycinendophyticum]
MTEHSMILAFLFLQKASRAYSAKDEDDFYRQYSEPWSFRLHWNWSHLDHWLSRVRAATCEPAGRSHAAAAPHTCR